MKKWWIGSLTMILMLLAFPLVAVTEELKCPEHPDATLTLTNIKKEDRHHVYWTCNQGQHEVLGYEGPHESTKATCTTAAECDYCGYVFKDPNNHDWDGMWKDCGDGKQHYQTCKNDENHKKYEDHVITAATCTNKAYTSCLHSSSLI